MVCDYACLIYIYIYGPMYISMLSKLHKLSKGKVEVLVLLEEARTVLFSSCTEHAAQVAGFKKGSVVPMSLVVAPCATGIETASQRKIEREREGDGEKERERERENKSRNERKKERSKERKTERDRQPEKLTCMRREEHCCWHQVENSKTQRISKSERVCVCVCLSLRKQPVLYIAACSPVECKNSLHWFLWTPGMLTSSRKTALQGIACEQVR